jgi:hypothetical protein
MSTNTPAGDRTVVRTTDEAARNRWPHVSVSSLLAGAVGVLLLVMGILALARTGIPADDLTTPAVAIGPFTRTALMGLIEIVAGMLALAAAADRAVGGAAFLGVIAGVFGIVWIIEPGAFNSALGVGTTTGWFYVIIAAMLLTAVALDRLRSAVP